MSRFGGAATAAAISVQETFNGNIVAPVFQGDYTKPHRVTVKINAGATLQNVIYGKPLEGRRLVDYIGLSVAVSKVGGRWVVL